MLLGVLFAPWFGKVSPFCVPLPGRSCERNFDAWQAFGVTDVVLLLAALSGIGLALVSGASSKTDAQITSAAMTVPIAFLATLLVLYRVIEPVGTLDPRYGLWIGLGACAAITYGSWRAVRNEAPSRVARLTRPQPASRTRSPSSSG